MVWIKKAVKKTAVFVVVFSLVLQNLTPVFASMADSTNQPAIPIPQLPKPFGGDFTVTREFGEVKTASDSAILTKIAELEGEKGHRGIDFAMPEGTEVLAVDDGEVIQAGEGDYGITVILKHSWGESFYGHLSSASVQAPQQVSKGEIIGLSGSTGLATGPHLQLGIKNSKGEWVDPSQYLGIETSNTSEVKSQNTSEVEQVLGEATPSASLTIPEMENIATDSAYLFNYKFNLINGNSAHFDSKSDPRPGFAIADKDYNYKLRFFLSTSEESLASPSARPPSEVSNNQIEFPVIVQGIPMTLRYTVTEDRVKEEIVIKEKPNNLQDNLIIPFEVQTVGLSVDQKDQQYTFTSADGSTYWRVPAPTLKDAQGQEGQIRGNLQDPLYTLTLSSDWLKQASYPVIIDPSVLVGSWQEVVSSRTQRSRTYQDTTNPNKYSWDGTLAPLHYESSLGSGNYNTQIDMTPVRVNNAQLDGWKVTQAGWHYALGQPGDKTTDGWVGFGGRQGANWFKFRLARAGYLHWPTRAWQDVGGTPTYNRANLSSQINSLTLGPNNDQIPAETVATWSNLWTTPGGGSLSVSWRANGERLKEEITLNQAGRNWIAANRPPTTPLTETYFGFVFQLDWSDIPKVIRAGIEQSIEGDFADDNENIEFKDSLDKLLAFMPLDNVKVPNANPLLVETQPLRKRFWKDPDGNYYLLVGIRTDTLNSMAAGDLVFDPTIDAQVGASTDDAEHYDGTDTGPWLHTNSTGAGFRRGSFGSYHSGQRFTGANISTGATITASYITFTGQETYSADTRTGRIRAELVAAPATFSTLSDYTGRTRTTNSVDWSVSSITLDVEYNSPSLNTVIQELVDTYSTSGIVIFANFVEASPGADMYAYSYDSSSTKAPKLHIEYTSNQNPSAPSSSGPTSLVDGSWGSDNTPTPTFTLSDPDAADTVKYQIQIDDTSDFSSAVVDYTSALAAQGSTSFTVGQAAGSGSYTTGTEGQTLSDGSYYWRVKTIDNSAAESAYSTANAGAIAFKVDTTAPTISSTASTPNSSGATMTWTTDESSSSKVDYGLTNSYGSSTTEADTSPRVTSHSVALTGLVACATYHYRVRSKDSASNETIDSDKTFTTTGCLGSATIESQTASTMTTASGGTVSLTSNNTGVTLTIPASFTNSDTNFQVKQLDHSPVITTASPPSGYSIIDNYTYDFKALNDVTTTVSSFDKQITIQITYTGAEIGGIEESTLKIYRWNGTAWQQLSGCTLDTAAKTVTCTTTVFSVFALFGQPSSSSTTVLSTTQTPGCGDTAPGPKAPWLYGALAQGQNAILLYFTSADGPVEKYVLQYGLTSGNYLWSAGDIGGRNTRTYLVKSLEPRTTYYFMVRASNGCAVGAWSNEISGRTGAIFELPSLEIINLLTGRPLSLPDVAAKIPKVGLPEVKDQLSEIIRYTSEVVLSFASFVSVNTSEVRESLAILSPRLADLGQSFSQSVAKATSLAKSNLARLDGMANEATYRVTTAYAILTGRGPNEITNVSVAYNSPTSVTIYWHTKHKSASKVNYGFDTAWGLEKQDSRYANDHYITLDNLEPGKTYYFEVMSQGIDYVYDAYYTFTTPNQPED